MLRRDKLTLAVLCAGHFVNDSYSSIIYPLLPLIKLKLGLSAAQIFWLAPLYAISSSLMQPVYGFISDRYFRRFFAVFGPAITGIFVSMIGLAPSYGILIVLLVAGGIGIGSFHPQAPALPAHVSSTPGVEKIKWQLLAALRTAWKPLTLLYLITVIRSGLQMTTNNYLPFMLEDRGYALTETGNVMTVFLLLGGIGGLAGGFTAERFSGRAVTLYSGL